ncbi:hypothetical protein V2J09_018230 [Rumex salicifolius]
MEVWFVGLLRAAWVAAILPILVASVPCSCLNNFRQILFLLCGRGKTLKTSSPMFTVPQKKFTHFYVVAVLSTSSLLLTTWIYAHETTSLVSNSTFLSNVGSHFTHGSNIFHIHNTYSSLMKERYKAWISLFLLLLMEVQALRRLYESVYVFNYSPAARMHVMGYLTGLFFYTAAPLSLCADLATDEFKHIVRDRNQMPDVEFQWWEYVIPLTKLGWSQWFGAIIFLWGSIHQYCCHAILGELREGKEKANDYVIPRGDWFELVSSPHYLAEMVIYSGIMVASGGTDLTIWLLYVFVVANLILAATETHRWYRSKFDNYPSNRYAVIPYTVYRECTIASKMADIWVVDMYLGGDGG